MATIITHTKSSWHIVAHVLPLVSVFSLPLIIVRRIRARRELMRLLSLPEYLLQDIGLQRDAITRESMKPFWRQ